MNDIFANLYNKVLGFFRKAEKEDTAKDVACSRLKFVLMQDRTNLTPELMERMRKELVELLSKYVEMDKEALELNLEQDGEQVALMLSIPVIRAKEEEEIKKILEEEKLAKEKLEEACEQETCEQEACTEKDEDNSEETVEEASAEETEETEKKEDKKGKKVKDANLDSDGDITQEAPEEKDVKEEVSEINSNEKKETK